MIYYFLIWKTIDVFMNKYVLKNKIVLKKYFFKLLFLFCINICIYFLFILKLENITNHIKKNLKCKIILMKLQFIPF